MVALSSYELESAMRTISAVMTLLFPLLSLAGGFKGMVTFTPEEKELHKKTLNVLMAKAASCLQADLDRQHQFVKRYGIAAFYGATSTFAPMNQSQREEVLRVQGVPASVLPELKSTSCVDFAAKCLAQGFMEAKQEAIWAKLRGVLQANDGDGSALQEALRELGWRVLYWNPDVSQNQAWDAAERALDGKNTGSFWGYHDENWKNVSKNGRYYLNHVDDAKTLVNIGARMPSFIKKIPYFLGSVHMGYHVYSGVYGQAYEAHASRLITDPETIERAPFNPYAVGGAPHGAFRSGIIAVPPGY